jgi:FkbM family methyltransferase
MNDNRNNITDTEVSDIMNKIKCNLNKRNGDLSGQSILNSVSSSNLNNSIALNQDLSFIHENSNIQNDTYLIHSHRPIFGHILKKGRELVNAEVKRYVGPILFKQSLFNGTLVRIISEIKTTLTFNQDRLSEVERLLTLNQDKINKMDQQLKNQISVYADNREHFKAEISRLIDERCAKYEFFLKSTNDITQGGNLYSKGIMHFRKKSWDASIDSTWDEAIFEWVVNKNEYGILNLDNAIILDVGAHIGSFAYIAKIKGSSRIYCYEAELENFELLKENLKIFNGIEVNYAAVWRSDMTISEVLFQKNINQFNTGGGGVMFQTGTPVPAVKFDDILNRIDCVDLLKIDAEGSEFPILFTSKQLFRVKEIVGEYHEIESIPDSLKILGHPEFTANALCTYLREMGYIVVFQHIAENLGKFHAWKPNVKRLSNLLNE